MVDEGKILDYQVVLSGSNNENITTETIVVLNDDGGFGFYNKKGYGVYGAKFFIIPNKKEICKIKLYED